MPQVYNTSQRAWAQQTLARTSAMNPLTALAELTQPPGGSSHGMGQYDPAGRQRGPHAGYLWRCFYRRWPEQGSHYWSALLHFQLALPV